VVAQEREPLRELRGGRRLRRGLRLGHRHDGRTAPFK
jgi:hypothetical protein